MEDGSGWVTVMKTTIFGDFFWLRLPQKVRCEKNILEKKKEEFLGRQTI